MPIKPENKNRYPKNWKEVSKRIRQRAHNFCECKGECGRHYKPCEAKNGWPHPITGSAVILTVAHLDHIPENCDDGNLKAMCQRCHLNYDMDHHARSRRESQRDKLTGDLFT